MTSLRAATPVGVDETIDVLLPSDASRIGFYARNTGPNVVALVETGGTFAGASIFLQPGENWREAESPSAAWYAICATGLTATINLLELMQ